VWPGEHEDCKVQGTRRCTRESNGWQTTYIHALCCANAHRPGRALQSRTSSCRPTVSLLATGAEVLACIHRHVSAGGWGATGLLRAAQGCSPPTKSRARAKPCDTRACGRMILCPLRSEDQVLRRFLFGRFKNAFARWLSMTWVYRDNH
jgi:hypothetical protein